MKKEEVKRIRRRVESIDGLADRPDFADDGVAGRANVLGVLAGVDAAGEPDERKGEHPDGH